MSPLDKDILIEYYFEEDTHNVILNNTHLTFPAEGGLPTAFPDNYAFLPLETKIEILKYMLDNAVSGDGYYLYISTFVPLSNFNPLLLSFLYSWNQYLDNSDATLLLWRDSGSYKLSIEPLGKNIIVSDFEICSILETFIHTGFYTPNDVLILE